MSLEYFPTNDSSMSGWFQQSQLVDEFHRFALDDTPCNPSPAELQLTPDFLDDCLVYGEHFGSSYATNGYITGEQVHTVHGAHDSPFHEAMQADISSHECGLLAPSLEDYAELQIKYPYVFRSLPDSMPLGKSFGHAPEVGIIKPAHAHRHTVDCDSDIDADGETESETSSDSSFTLSSSVDGDASDDEYIPSPRIKNRSIRTRTRARAPAKPRTRSSPYPRSNASSSRSASPRNSPSREPSSGPQRGPIGPRPRNMQSAPVHVAPPPRSKGPGAYTCPICFYVQTNRRRPDLTRHIVTHYATVDPERWVCCGLPVDDVAAQGLDVEPDTERVYEGMQMVGGCGKTFSRRDALKRHLDNRNVKCVGDSNANYLRGNH